MSRPDLEWRAPREDEYPTLYRMMATAYHAADAAFPEDPAIFARYTECDPHFSPEDWVAGWIDHEPAAALRVFSREIRVAEPGRTARLAGIGNVAAHPAFTGQRLGSALLEQACRVIRERGFELSLLYASRHGFYQRAGWMPVRRSWTRLELHRPLSGHASSVREGGSPAALHIAEATGADSRAVLGAARRLYDTAYGALPGSLIRSEAYWLRWIGGFSLGEMKGRLLVAFRGTAPVAYVAGRHTDDGLEVFEGFDETEDGSALLALATELAGDAVVIRWPEVPWLDSILGTLDGTAAAITRDAGLGRSVAGEGPFPPTSFLLSSLDHF